MAVNPYKSVPIYGQSIVNKYTKDKLGVLPPHIFAVANDAYESLMRQPTKPRAILIRYAPRTPFTGPLTFCLQWRVGRRQDGIDQANFESFDALVGRALAH